jgi:hypothetical protein
MSYDMIEESVPEFIRRVGDLVYQGSNNTIIILGTDRAAPGPAGLGDGLGHTGAADKGKGAGTIHLIAGRNGKDPDMSKDKSFMYLSMKTNADSNLALSALGTASKKSAAVIKSDCIRIVCKEDIEIAVDGESSFVTIKKNGDIVVKGKNVVVEGDIKLGSAGASKKLVTEDFLLKLFDLHGHPPLAGAPGMGPPTLLSTTLPTALTQKVKAE